MITLSQLIRRLRPILAANADIADWCRTNYAKAPLIQSGFGPKDEDRNPAQPWIVLLPGNRRDPGTDRILTVRIRVVIGEMTAKKSGGPDAPIAEWPVAELLPDLADLILDAVADQLIDWSLEAGDSMISYDFAQFYPLAAADLTVPVAVPQPIGYEPELPAEE